MKVFENVWWNNSNGITPTEVSACLPLLLSSHRVPLWSVLLNLIVSVSEVQWRVVVLEVGSLMFTFGKQHVLCKTLQQWCLSFECDAFCLLLGYCWLASFELWKMFPVMVYSLGIFLLWRGISLTMCVCVEKRAPIRLLSPPHSHADISPPPTLSVPLQW